MTNYEKFYLYFRDEDLFIGGMREIEAEKLKEGYSQDPVVISENNPLYRLYWNNYRDRIKPSDRNTLRRVRRELKEEA